MTLGLGGSRDEVEEAGDVDKRVSEERLLGTSGRLESGARELGGLICLPMDAR